MGLAPIIASALSSIVIGNSAIVPPVEEPDAQRAPAVQTRILLNNSGATSNAVLSPAGDRIIFRNGALGKGVLLEKFKDGRGRRLATDARNGVWANPKFSPKGLYLMLDQLDPKTRQIRKIVVRRVNGGDKLLEFPAGGVATWGPAGKRIAFTHPVAGVSVVDFPSGKVKRFIPVKSSGEMPVARFSPNGQLLAIVDHPGEAECRLRLVRLSNGKSMTLTKADGVKTAVPFWSQDGTRLGAIVFGARHGPNATTIMVWNTRKPRALPKSVYANIRVSPYHTPAFSPNGKSVAFVHRSARDGKTDVFALPVSGGKPARLTRSGDVTGSIRWDRTGNLVVEGGSRVLVVNR